MRLSVIFFESIFGSGKRRYPGTMGVRSFLIEVRQTSDLDLVEKWSNIISNLASRFDGICPQRDWNHERRAGELIPMIKMLKAGHLSIVEGKESTGDYDLSPCGFKYYCGRVWLLISTWSAGEAVVMSLMETILPENAYTRLWCVRMDDYDPLPTITFEHEEKETAAQRWKGHKDLFATFEFEPIPEAEDQFIDYTVDGEYTDLVKKSGNIPRKAMPTAAPVAAAAASHS